RVVGHLGDVGAGGERLVARAGQDDPTDRGVVAGVLEDLVQLGDGGLVKGVEHLRPIDRHIRDCSLFLVQNILARGRSGSGTHGCAPVVRSEFLESAGFASLSDYTKALSPVIALPTIRFCIWYVPS